MVRWAPGLTNGDIYKARGTVELFCMCVQVIPSPAQGIMLPLFGCLQQPGTANRAVPLGRAPPPRTRARRRDSPGPAPSTHTAAPATAAINQ